MIQPIVVEVFGEPEVGKTEIIFNSVKFGYNPICFDTSPSGESKAAALKYFGEKICGFCKTKGLQGGSCYQNHWVPVNNLNELRIGVKKALQEGYNVIGIDTTADLQDMAIAEWLDEPEQKRRGRVRPMPEEYGVIRDKIDEIIREIMKTQKAHLILTAKMKDEYTPVVDESGKVKMTKWGESERILMRETGRRIRDGLDKDRIGFGADIRLYLFLEEVNTKDEKGNPIRKIERRALVYKNRFCSKEGKGWITYLKGDEEVSWSGIIKLATIPVEQGGQGIKEEWLR